MANMSPTKTPVAEQAPHIRNKNFKEVSLGYTPQEAIEEAKRCLNCKNPLCVMGCPVNVKIPEFISLMAEGLTPLALSEKTNSTVRHFQKIIIHYIIT